MLNMAEVELELISDADMYLLFEKGMRGGVSYISKRYSKANKKYLKFYDPKQESKHIYLAGKFKWIDPKEFDSNKYTKNSSKVCVLELDPEYPKELCELHSSIY